MKPWEQQPGESSQAFRAARVYFEAGPKRTLVGVQAILAGDQDHTGTGPEPDQNRTRKASSTLKGWSSKWNWVERAKAFDQRLDQVADQARETERVNQATILEQRRARIADDNWAIGQALRARGIEMIQWPIKESTSTATVSEDGRTVHQTIIQPTNWRMRDAVGFLRLGTELACLAVGMPIRVQVPSSTTPETPPVDQVQADEDNGRVPPWGIEKWHEFMAAQALEHEGRADAQPDQ